MKNLLFVFLFALIALVPLNFGQIVSYDGRVVNVNYETVANSVTETGYVSLDGWTTIDSISVVVFGVGETDIDSLDIYVGNGGAGVTAQYSATVYHYAVTVNAAAAAVYIERLYSANATLLTKAVLRNANRLKIVTRGATSGNDATDPNKLVVQLIISGTK